MFTSIDSIPAAGPYVEQNLLRFNQAIFGAISQGGPVADRRRVIVASNDAFCTITGYARAEVIGRDRGFLQGTDTDPVTVGSIHGAVNGDQG